MSDQLPDVKGLLPMPAVKPPADCRQRLWAEGKPIAKSNCAVCGQFSPRWKECDAALSAPVPPAGDVEVLEVYGYQCRQSAQEKFFLHEYPHYWQHIPLVRQADAMERITRLTAERDGLMADAARKVILAVQDICELEPADTTDPECICITASDLGRILSRHFEGVE